MRVMFVSLHFAELAVTLANGIPRHEVLLVLNEANAARELPSDVVAGGARIKVAGPKRLLRFLRAFIQFAVLYFRWRPRVVHFQEFPSELAFLCWLLSAPSRRILTVHDVEPHPGRDSSMPLRLSFLRNRMRQQADKIVVHAEILKTRLVELFRIEPNRVQVIPHVALRKPLPMSSSATQRLSVLFFGRMETYKGLEVLVEALELGGLDECLELHVAGEGPELDRLRSRLGRRANVCIYEGRVSPDGITALMARIDVVALPYVEASQSGVVAMAFGLGRPVVASAVGGVPEVVMPRENGLLVEPRDAQALNKALRTLACDRELLQQLTQGAVETAAGAISPSVVGRRTADLYDEVCERR